MVGGSRVTIAEDVKKRGELCLLRDVPVTVTARRLRQEAGEQQSSSKLSEGCELLVGGGLEADWRGANLRTESALGKSGQEVVVWQVGEGTAIHTSDYR